MQRAQESLGVNYASEIRWSQERLGELWKLRGAFPGLGSALAAFGIDHAILLAFRITNGLSETDDPWPAVQAVLDDPASIGPEWEGRIGPTMAKKLAGLPDERRALLHLLARFDLFPAQATRFYLPEERARARILVDDLGLLQNPYLLYEADRISQDAIPVTVIDRGSYPSPAVTSSLPIPAPSAMTEPQDPRRVRALMVAALERSGHSGNTLLPQDQLVTDVRSMPVEPPCPIDGDLLAVIGDSLKPALQPARMLDGRPGHQLDRLSAARTRISQEVRKRYATKKRHTVEADWRTVLDDLLYPEQFPEGSPFRGPSKFVANGEIGMVVGQFKRRGERFKVTRLEVEFSTQRGVKYGFGSGYLPRDGDNPVLELAYALTVHKSQGSEFGTTFLVIPNPCQLLSRELLYTALTRQTKRVVVLHQGPLADLLSFSSVGHSETARRYTNLLRDPQPQDIGGGLFLEANLIHRTSNGTLVRSKSEVIIGDALSAAGVEFAYEKEFRGHDGSLRLPDFTIEDAATGETYIWEHLGMLSNPQYARAWERKKAWYAASGVAEGGGEAATLIVTTDDERGGIDSAEVQAKVQEIA